MAALEESIAAVKGEDGRPDGQAGQGESQDKSRAEKSRRQSNAPKPKSSQVAAGGH